MGKSGTPQPGTGTPGGTQMTLRTSILRSVQRTSDPSLKTVWDTHLGQVPGKETPAVLTTHHDASQRVQRPVARIPECSAAQAHSTARDESASRQKIRKGPRIWAPAGALGARRALRRGRRH